MNELTINGKPAKLLDISQVPAQPTKYKYAEALDLIPEGKAVEMEYDVKFHGSVAAFLSTNMKYKAKFFISKRGNKSYIVHKPSQQVQGKGQQGTPV
jgi:hypothetical protein